MASNQVKIQFHNIASWMSGDSQYTTDGSNLFFFSKSPDLVYNHPWVNFDNVIDSISSQDDDIISFSEVFGTRQRDYIKNKLEQMGYVVYFTDAFEMWSQSVPWEHLYNITWVREDKLGTPNVDHHQLRNKRKIAGIAIAAKYFLSDSLGEWGKNKTEQLRYLHNRLSKGILDGAISFLEFDNFTLATGHVHKFNKEVISILEWRITEKSFVLMGDMNVSHWENILLQPPFNTFDWNTLLNPRWRTFTGSFRNPYIFGVAHIQPDVMIAKWIIWSQAEFIPKSFGDHTTIWAIIDLPSKK